jgi:hypothetical protein
MGETGRLGFFALGNAIEDSARSMGVAGQASRQLGNSVERVAASALPAFGAAIGMTVLAVTAAVAMISKYTAEKKLLREETIKASDAASKWIVEMEGQINKTKGLKAAEYELYLERRRQNRETLTEGIVLKEREIQKLKDEIDVVQWMVDYEKDRLTPSDLKRIDRVEKSIRMKERELNVDRETLAMYGKKAATQAQTEGAKPYTTADRLASEAEYLSAIHGLWSTQNADYQGSLDMQLAILDAHNSAKLSAMDAAGASARQVADTFAAMDIGRETFIAAEKKRIAQQELSNRQAVYGGLASLADQFYNLTHKRQKAFWYAAKMFAATEAHFQYLLAAAKAAGQAGIFGLTMEEYYKAMSYVVPAMIMATSLTEGPGGGGGGGATPTFDANPATGYPTTQPSTSPYGNLTLIINGQERTIQEITEGVFNEAYRQNGTVGGISIAVVKD